MASSAGPISTQTHTHTAPTTPLERHSSITGILVDSWAVQKFVVLRVWGEHVVERARTLVCDSVAVWL